MARIDDLGDRLRLGMNKLQAAVGETARGAGGGGEPSISLEEAEALRQEEMEGVRERFSKTVAELNDQVGIPSSGFNRNYNAQHFRFEVQRRFASKPFTKAYSTSNEKALYTQAPRKELLLGQGLVIQFPSTTA